MTGQITINPGLTTNAAGTFNVQSVGLVQGTAYPDPAVRFALNGGVLNSTETLPGWGGMGLFEYIPGASGGPNVALGCPVGRATALTGSKALTAFSVFDQAYAMVNSPQSPVPLAAVGNQLNYYRLGSGARLVVAADPALISLRGSIVSSQVSWDFTNQLLVPYEASAYTISSGTYNNTTGVVVLTLSGAAAFSAGDAVIVSSLTGTGAYASLNGTFTATVVSGTSVTYNAGPGLGASTITGGSLTQASGAASALNVQVLDIQQGNCMTVQYDPSTGFATWNRNGTAAVIKI